ncbi:M23 family metallopeptidase [Cellulomonas carbonis]|uniref:Peptidase M23 n=1 Tax=Cellulomonas carbonis T26 TaxID=947969 RepID=A0A0A0BUC6_9CELL|nr:M23 family metallopeptidase [Cellulomonas carbonis]KGM11585.1 peptidase M23 [Cellulomonas carbonis T26]GGC06885.1 hypothetical protein GCM10010972_20170 [Cellulomonas carbonis]
MTVGQAPPDRAPVVLALPFEGRWLVRNSPARRVPSHGVDLPGERYAIDFVGVDERGRPARRRDWRTAFATEPPERFAGFGRPILAPVDGEVVVAHDGEPDHEARRSQLALVPYALGQASRLRRGVGAIAGNHVVLATGDPPVYVALVHLQAGSLAVRVRERVVTGQPLARCGSSGNSTQPHVHVQVMDDVDLAAARGVPMAFRDFLERRRGARDAVLRREGVPAVEPSP